MKSREPCGKLVEAPPQLRAAFIAELAEHVRLFAARGDRDALRIVADAIVRFLLTCQEGESIANGPDVNDPSDSVERHDHAYGRKHEEEHAST